ncbi:MAG TPA: PIN domain nuclease [Cellvibrionaceae bacterium]
MIVVDSSVWIDYFCGKDTLQTDQLDQILGAQSVAIGDIILTEVLQGFRSDKEYTIAKSLLGEFVILDMLGKHMALKSAHTYRKLRKKGVTVRKTIDVIIATYCIEHRLPLLFSDKDFKPLVTHMGLIAF